MAERSRPWFDTVLGDAGPYSFDQWTDTWLTLLGPLIAQEGVFFDQLNDLVLTGAASPVSVDTGRALVDGTWYESTAAVAVAIPTPAGNPRIDRIVLRKDWALQTIRITRIAGAEAAAPVPPALTQVDGVTWDLPLWQVHITVAPVLTIFRDERLFLGQYEPAGYSTPDEPYLEDEFFYHNAVFADGDKIKHWLFTIDAGAGNSITIFSGAGFSSGAIRQSHGALTGDFIAITSTNFRPDQILAKLLMIVKDPNTDADLDRVVGFVSAANTLTPTDGTFFMNEGGVDANWHARSRAGGVQTDTDTGIALADTWKKLEIRVRSGVAEYLIDDVIVATHTANVPSDVSQLLSLGVLDDGAAAPASAAYQDVDLVRVRGTGR